MYETNTILSLGSSNKRRKKHRDTDSHWDPNNVSIQQTNYCNKGSVQQVKNSRTGSKHVYKKRRQVDNTNSDSKNRFKQGARSFSDVCGDDENGWAVHNDSSVAGGDENTGLDEKDNCRVVSSLCEASLCETRWGRAWRNGGMEGEWSRVVAMEEGKGERCNESLNVPTALTRHFVRSPGVHVGCRSQGFRVQTDDHWSFTC